jgi:hypothetical protein
MNSPTLTTTRPIPVVIEEKYRAWKHWASVWNWIHIIVGGSSVALSTVVVANTRSDFLGSKAIEAASAAAIGAFLLTTLNPQKTAKGFVNAYRHLEKAICRFRFDASLSEIDLGKADAEGVDLLD